MKLNSFMILIVTAILSSSCALNRTFLKPTRLPDNAQSETLYIQGDTVTVDYRGEDQHPLFIRNGKDTVQFKHTIESVMFKSTSGNLLNGWIIKSKEVQPKATILFFHGNSGDIAHMHWAMNLLLQYGFQVFAIDYSGYGLSQGRATRKNVLKDGNSALDYLLTRPDVKNTKIVIYGQSLGGHLSVVVAAMNQNKIDGLVEEGGFSSHKEIGKAFAGSFGKMMVKEEYSAKDSIVNFHKPILIIHSKEDEVVPFEMGQELYNLANEPKEFYIIDGCHTCGSRIYAKEIAEKILKMVGL